MKLCSTILVISLLSLLLPAQDFVNGDLEGPILGISMVPPDWSAVPQSDPSCAANFAPGTTPDLTGISAPDIELGLIGNPYSGNTFVSAIAADSYGFVYMEGIKQTVYGFIPDSIYEVHFHQAVVKQANMKDNSGSWEVYINNTLIGVSDVSSSPAPYFSTNFNWDKRSIVFTATASTLIFKFFAKDNDDNGVIDEYDASGALRMGIDSIFITPWCNLNADLGHDTLLCAGDSLILSVTSANADYLWQDGSTDDSFLVTQEGTYSVSVSNVCGVLSDQVFIEFDNSVQNLELGDDLEMCDGDTLMLALQNPDLNYLWQDSSNQSYMEITESGMYWLELSSDNCTNHDTIMALFNPLPQFELPPDTILCYGETMMLEANISGADFLWQDNSTNPFYQVFQGGQYWLIVTENGCHNIAIVNIHYIPEPHLQFPNDTLICLGQQLRLAPEFEFSEFEWQDNASTSPIRYISEPGIYALEITNPCGFDKDSIEVRFDDCKCFVYIPNAFSPNYDGRNDEFKVEYDCFFTSFDLKIYDRWGQLIYQSSNPDAMWDGLINGKEVPIGVYAYRIEYLSYGRDLVTRNGTITLLH
jgi:gliding motility-associated-like protein